MTDNLVMNVSLRLPDRQLYKCGAVKLTARSVEGAFGVLPNHIDFVIALMPCVLMLTASDGDERIFGIDEGVLVKHGEDVDICVLRAVQSDDIDGLKATVRNTFTNMDEQEKIARSALSRLEADMARHFAKLKEIR